MLCVIQVNRLDCGGENNAGMLQREAEMPRERQAVVLTYVNFQKLFPVIVSIVDCDVIMLLLAADKPLEESGLCWILSGGRQTGSTGSTRQPGWGFFGCSSFSSLSLHQQDDAACEDRGSVQRQISAPLCHHVYMQLAGCSYLQQLTGPRVHGL